jgi:hypothetical protein
VNKGLEILLARMDSHPQDFNFLQLQPRQQDMWGLLIEVVRDENRSGSFVTHEERAALEDKMNKVQGEIFTGAVLERVLHYDSCSQQLPAKQQV